MDGNIFLLREVAKLAKDHLLSFDEIFKDAISNLYIDPSKFLTDPNYLDQLTYKFITEVEDRILESENIYFKNKMFINNKFFVIIKESLTIFSKYLKSIKHILTKKLKEKEKLDDKEEYKKDLFFKHFNKKKDKLILELSSVASKRLVNE